MVQRTVKKSNDFRLKLTTRELQVLSALDSDKSLHDIAEDLGIKYKTLVKHCGNIYKKFGAHSRQSSVIRGIEKGLLVKNEIFRIY